MMTPKSLTELQREIVAQGYDNDTAWRYAVLIGDTPISDGQGGTIVQDEQGRQLAHLGRLALFE